MEYFPLWLQSSGVKGSLLHSPIGCHLQVVLLCIPGEVYKHLKWDTVETVWLYLGWSQVISSFSDL